LKNWTYLVLTIHYIILEILGGTFCFAKVIRIQTPYENCYIFPGFPVNNAALDDNL
jgi:hypothetical protein